jgi:drug/metabolite transporter (DMT)-like permease
MPIVALSWGLLDGEKFTLIQGFATLIILIGVWLANKKKQPVSRLQKKTKYN